MFRSLAILVGISLVPFGAGAAVKTMAVLGDSVSVGSLTHPDVSYDLDKIVEYFDKGPYKPSTDVYSESVRRAVLGKDETMTRAKRVFESVDEHPELAKDPLKRFGEKTKFDLISGLVKNYVDFPEYAWPYMVGRAQGIAGDNIIVVGEAGRRAGDTLQQMKRLLIATKNKVPDHTFIFWTGNNLCSTDIKEDKPEDQQKVFFNDVMKGVTELVEKGKVDKGETAHVFIPGFIQVSQLIKEKAILEKSVYAFGKKRTCEDFRAFDPGMVDARAKIKNETIILAMKTFKDIKNLPPVKDLCRSVLTVKKDDKEQIGRIEKFVEAYRLAAKEVVKKANELKKPGFQFHYLESTEGFFADEKEIGPDCFHPSVAGNEKLAKSILQELKKQKLIDDYQI